MVLAPAGRYPASPTADVGRGFFFIFITDVGTIVDVGFFGVVVSVDGMMIITVASGSTATTVTATTTAVEAARIVRREQKDRVDDKSRWPAAPRRPLRAALRAGRTPHDRP